MNPIQDGRDDMTQETPETPTTSWLDIPISKWIKTFDFEKLFFAIILIVAILSRLSMLGTRVMAHDEINHLIPSYQLFKGEGYMHDPVTHGPMQFHLIAMAYTLFGDTDFNSRLPHALFSIATVWMVWKYRRYLGRVGALAAAAMMCISPFMLFYGRYARNEAFVGLFAVLTIYMMLRYLEQPDNKYLLGLAAVFAMQFCTKETAYIYSAQALLFLAIVFFKRIFQSEWRIPRDKITFIIGLAAGLIFFASFAIISHQVNASIAPEETAATVTDTAQSLTGEAAAVPGTIRAMQIAAILASLAGFGVAAYYVYRGYGLEAIRADRSFDLLMLLGTLVLPELTAFPLSLVGIDVLQFRNASSVNFSAVEIIAPLIGLVLMLLISVGLGLWWKKEFWWKPALIFYGIFIFLYTTMFTNGVGFFTGILGSLAYWLSQQGVERGGQPMYYYALIEIPIYEFLPAIGTILGIVYAVRRWVMQEETRIVERYSLGTDAPQDQPPLGMDEQLPVWMLVFWSISALGAYSVAGERMPWLTVHITWPMILLAGWAFGRYFTHVNWRSVFSVRGAIYLTCTIFMVIGLGRIVAALNTTPLPFAGNQLDQLQVTSTFLFSIAVVLGSLAAMFFLKRLGEDYKYGQFIGSAVIALLAVLTVRASYRANFILYDTAKEYLVYAHAARGPLDILDQVEEISERMTGGLGLRIGYDTHSNYPYWWYLRHYTNLHFYDAYPSKDLLNDEIVIAGNPLYTKVDPILAKDYYSFEYVRLWWPNQDYFGLTWDKVKEAITNPAIREGIFDIWYNRDYTKYAEATNSTVMTEITWEPAERMKLYIRKDLMTRMWNYGAAPVVAQAEVDPYEEGMIVLAPDVVVGTVGSEAGQFNSPRGVAVAPDNSFYVADASNHRIQHFSSDGVLINEWGSFGDVAKDAPGGTFNEPWGVAVGPDGSVYVTDTWNGRVQKFSADGTFIKAWGKFGQGPALDEFYGPRGIAVGPDGRVYVTDTGNKRVVIFDADGNPVSAFGSAGMEAGQFDEPVGITVDASGDIYVADTWNQRVQVFDGKSFDQILSFDVSAWSSQSLDNKPFIAVDDIGNIFITDPEGYRVIEFSSNGEFLRTWGEYSPESDGFGLSSGIATDKSGGLWVSDSANGRLLHFLLQ